VDFGEQLFSQVLEHIKAERLSEVEIEFERFLSTHQALNETIQLVRRVANKAMKQLRQLRRRSWVSVRILEVLESHNVADISVYTSAMCACVANKKFNEALVLRQRAVSSGVAAVPDAHFVSVSLQCMRWSHSFDERLRMATDALKLQSIPQSSHTPILNTLVHECPTVEVRTIGDKHANSAEESHMHTQDVFRVLRYIEDNQLTLLTETINTALGVISFRGSDLEMHHALKMMQAHNIVPDLITYNTLISRQHNTEKPSLKHAMRVYQSLLSAGLTPDVFTFNSLMACCVKAGDAHEAEHVLQLMRAANVTKDEYTLNQEIKLCRITKDAHRVLSLLRESLSPSQGMYTNALKVCLDTGNIDIPLQLFEDMQRRFQSLDVVSHTVGMEAYVAAGKLELALQNFERMVHGDGFPYPNRRTVSVLVGALMQSRAPQDVAQFVQRLASLPGNLLCSFTCQRVIKFLLTSNEPRLALELHAKHMREFTCTRGIFSELLAAAEALVVPLVETVPKRQGMSLHPVSVKAWQIAMECDTLVRAYSSTASFLSGHLETLAELHESVGAHAELLETAAYVQDNHRPPSIFTVSQCVRAAKFARRPSALVALFRWAVEFKTFLPFAVINSAISFAFRCVDV
jgi:pentatricopeptide repeat protein